ncbi:MAG: ribulose-phosphate 3-epimerase [Proteobacteria bacterium]|nr:MAG: ribulose-phosphate 3-epimerase [Pseudomonadota bacterium]PIE65311.1 MAG: ribulose-phosphate 3-epimerase [Desulfobacterales bacterium]
MKDVLIAPSILSADFTNLGDEIRGVDEAGADVIHIDVMDGHFVPNITIGPLVVKAVRKITVKPLDVHLMIMDADRYIDAFAAAGADWITVHVEACTHLQRTVSRIREHGLKAGVVLNPATPLSTLDYILADIDLVMLMSVNPGFGGQSFLPVTLTKIRALRSIIAQHSPEVLIEVDGGVAPETIGPIAEAGAHVFVAGSAIYGCDEYAPVISELREKAMKAKRIVE